MKVFAFERLGDDLPFMPLAVRRALDRVGVKISFETWRNLDIAQRLALLVAGSAEVVDVAGVLALLEGLAQTPVAVLDEPLPLPKALADRIDEPSWTSLHPVDRYALTKVAAKGDAHRLNEVLDEIWPISSHLTARGEIRMVDIASKEPTLRRAVAEARVAMRSETIGRLVRGDTPKGDVLATVRVAAIQAAKRTSALIPLCHAVSLTHVAVEFHWGEGTLLVRVAAEALDRTGVEMEAMVAASAAALTLYDMLKGIDRSIHFDVKLVEKSGGRSGHWRREAP